MKLESLHILKNNEERKQQVKIERFPRIQLVKIKNQIDVLGLHNLNKLCDNSN